MYLLLEKAISSLDIHFRKDALPSLGSCFKSSFLICKVPRNLIILKACEQILLSESLEEDFSVFVFSTFLFDEVVVLLKFGKQNNIHDSVYILQKYFVECVDMYLQF